MNKYKHNKKRNVAFLYEVLIIELIKSVVSNNSERQNVIKTIIKEHFGKKSTLLNKELKLYKSINDSPDDAISAEKVLQEIKREYDSLDKDQLFREQSKLMFKIKKYLGDSVFSNFVPNYKNLASLSQIFNRDVSIKSRILLEKEILATMTNKSILTESQMVPIDNLVLKTFVKKFNDQYSNLHEEQKSLLGKYIISFSDNGLELKTFLNEEISRLKDEVKKSTELDEIKSNLQMSSMIKEVLMMLEGYAKQEISNIMIEQVIKIQNLVREIKINDTTNQN